MQSMTLKCNKCGVWYNAHCTLHHREDVIDFVKRDKRGDRMFEKDADGDDVPVMAQAKFPRIEVSEIEPHDCKRKGGFEI